MEYNKFENQLRKVFNSQEEAVDVSKIMAGVIASEKKDYKAIYICFAILLIVGVSSFYIIGNKNDVVSQVKFENALEKNQVGNKSPKEITLDSKNVQITNEVNDVMPLSSITKSIETQNKINKSTLIKSTPELYDTPSSKSLIKKKNDFNKNLNTAYLENVANPLMSDLNDTELNNISKFEVNRTKRKNVSHSSLSGLSPEYLHSTNEKFNFASPNLVECPKFKKNPWIFEVGTIMGVSNPVKRFSINPNEINPALTSRAENEKSLEGLDLEFYLSAKRTRWPVFVKSGIAYSRWTEQIDLDRNFTEIDTVQGVISATVSTDGDTLTFIYGDIFIERDVQIRRRVHYYINRVNIPLSLVYEGDIGKNSAYQIELGTSFNVSTFSAGSIYSSEDTFTKVNAGEFFRTLTGVSYFSKLHYRRYFTESTFVGALGHFHFLPSEFSRSNAFSQKYVNYGLSLYAGYRF